jgi:hypothetical protein
LATSKDMIGKNTRKNIVLKDRGRKPIAGARKRGSARCWKIAERAQSHNNKLLRICYGK